MLSAESIISKEVMQQTSFLSSFELQHTQQRIESFPIATSLHTSKETIFIASFVKAVIAHAG